MIVIVLLLVAVVAFVSFMGGIVCMLHAMRKCCPKAYEIWNAYLVTRG